MKLLFVYDLIPEHALHWRDGLWAALKEMTGGHFALNQPPALGTDTWVRLANLQTLGGDTLLSEASNGVEKYDFVLGWGGSGAKVTQELLAYKKGKKGLCFSGGDINDPSLDTFDVVFVENESYLIKPNFKLAFGTNTALFQPLPQPKMIDALYPAAFAAWKHQEVFAKICYDEELRGLAVGYIQRNNLQESTELMEECRRQGVAVMDWVPAETLVWLYNMTIEVIVTADASGGGERTILEAKACGVPVRVVSQSQKLLDLSRLTSEEVRQNWSHISYAEALKKGINAVLSDRR